MKSSPDQTDNIELLRQNSPEYLTRQRLDIIRIAVMNLEPYAAYEAVKPSAPVPMSQEAINHTVQNETASVIATAEEITRNTAQDLSVERLVETAKDYAQGVGNPLIDEALKNA